MVFRSRLLLIIAAVIAAVVLASILLTMPRLSTNHSAVAEAKGAVAGKFAATNQVVVGSPISISVPIYVVGPLTLVQKLVSVGVNQSLIKPVTVSELPSLPGNSLILIDWSVIGPGLITNVSGLVHVNVSSTGFKLIRELIRRGDFLIIHGNASEAPAIELALATAWANAFNASVMAIPVPRYLNGLNYVIAYGNNHVLIIGPHTLSDALNIASKYWIPTIMKISTPDPTGDLCWTLAQDYGLPTNQPGQVNNSYIIIYGYQSYSDSYGSFLVDFCVSWSGIVDEDYNGYSVGSAQLYNFVEYEPGSGTQIVYLKSFQDALASYMVYEYETGQTSQLPGDVQYIAGSGGGYEPGYWTNPNFTPTAAQCDTSQSYTIGIATIWSETSSGITYSSSVTYTYSCPAYTMSVTGPSTSTPLGPTAANITWTYTPQNTQQASQYYYYGTESDGPTYMGTAYNPQSSAYTIPAGASAVVENGACTEHIVYDINWDVWVNSNGAMNPYSSGAYIVPPAASSWNSNNGFYYTESC